MAPAQPVHRTRQATKIMNQYTSLFSTTQPSAKHGALDSEAAAADLTAFLDFSAYTHADSIVVPEAAPAPLQTGAFSNAFDMGAGALRPVDDALLDSPLDLELSPASSFASSISGSPYDLAVSAADFTSPLMSSFESPLVEPFAMPASTTGEYPSLFAPAPGTDLLASAALSMGASFAVAPEAQWAPAAASAPQVDLSFATLPMSSPMEDVKPIIAPSPVISRTDSALFGLPAVETTPAAAPASTKRKSIAQLKKEAALAQPESAFQKDKFTGVRNTKKAPVDYNAPTLPKNYLTESATSKKRGGPTKVAASLANKRARTASATPGPSGVDLPATASEPLNADDLDEEQLTAIEAKRRVNTLAARRSRARKAQHIQDLTDEVERLKALNEALQAELAAARSGCTCQQQQQQQ
ncbi:hypothetical protein Rhopal_006586-T1 [Rhodotorula paludigena]|uniref:BZIP domain-containing protein n=1 Tax=Rhodotorula paludigena TaxID=86838 RepID=A0AAV5GWG4_9BASI|nr:hypothetical protein Rhopal_006586-T1 [Rhodotorula paludigena]